MTQRLISFGGLFVLMGLAWLMSSSRKRINLRLVIGGLLLQFVLALVILRTPPGQWLFAGIGTAFDHFIGFVDHGGAFVFGDAATQQAVGEGKPLPDDSPLVRFYFALRVLPTIIVFASLMGIFYYLGIMQWVVNTLARLMQITLKTSGAESLAAAANVFVGHTEAPLVVRPYINGMTMSELNAMMVGGFATITGGLLAAYAGMGIDAGHLVTASVISAPAALLIAKIMQPEVEVPQTSGNTAVDIPRQGVNVIEAAAIGASDGMKLAANVAVMLIAFLALIAMINAGVGWLGSWFGQEWSLEVVMGVLFAPIAWVMGIPWHECHHAGELLGLKIVTNEFIAYDRLGQWITGDSELLLSKRSQDIMIYALSGFSNFGAIGIQLGGIGGLAPDRRSDLAKLGFRAMIGGALACCMTACIAGVLLVD
ncbi:MAG: NupC/NupG family nucleoside CNT transporter [Planctomycetota bacterium]|nr:NupC/NupG family nucleoside CNT transporter [Planctomycetota bacterium]